jgi:hypothetical protein
MPFVHWIPKSVWRRYAITFYIHLGIGKKPPEVPPPGKDVLIERYFRESMDDTFYRPYKSIGKVFVDNGFYIAFPVTNHRRIHGSRLFNTLLRLPLFEKFLVWFMMTFHNAYLLLLLPKGGLADGADFIMDNWKTRWISQDDISGPIHPGTKSHQPAG